VACIHLEPMNFGLSWVIKKRPCFYFACLQHAGEVIHFGVMLHLMFRKRAASDYQLLWYF
jgi:hypothetical protein